jgi:hypothetical protein
VKLLPVPRGFVEKTCPFCQGSGLVCLTVPPGPRECPTCRGVGRHAETWLTCGGMLQRARELGLAQ